MDAQWIIGTLVSVITALVGVIVYQYRASEVEKKARSTDYATRLEARSNRIRQLESDLDAERKQCEQDKSGLRKEIADLNARLLEFYEKQLARHR